MKKLLSTTLVALGLTAAASITHAGPFPTVFGAEDVSHGVFCEINEVRVLAQNEEDCTKAGGKVTHTVTTKKEAK